MSSTCVSLSTGKAIVLSVRLDALALRTDRDELPAGRSDAATEQLAHFRPSPV
jgi:hypothetical protein